MPLHPLPERSPHRAARPAARVAACCCAAALGMALSATAGARDAADTDADSVLTAWAPMADEAGPDVNPAEPVAGVVGEGADEADAEGAGAVQAGAATDAGLYGLTPGRFQSGRYLPPQLQYLDRLDDGRLQWQARLLGTQQRSASVYGDDGTPFRFVAPGDDIGAALRVLYSGLSAHTLMLDLQARRSTGADSLAFADAEAPTRYSAAVQDEWRWSGGLHANAGLRVDRSSAALIQSSPYAALIWQAQPATALKALYGRSHPASTADQDAYVERMARLGNPVSDGEGIDRLEATLDQRLDGELLLRAVAYRWSVGDGAAPGAEAADDAALALDTTGRKTVAHGLELSADKRWPWGSRLRGSVSLQRVLDGDGGLAPNAPAWLGKLDFSTRLPLAGLQLGCELRYDVAQRGSDGGDATANAVSNLRLHSDRLADGLDVGISVRNLLDTRDALPVSYGQDPAGQAGRSVRLDAVYRF